MLKLNKQVRPDVSITGYLNSALRYHCELNFTGYDTRNINRTKHHNAFKTHIMPQVTAKKKEVKKNKTDEWKGVTN